METKNTYLRWRANLKMLRDLSTWNDTPWTPRKMWLKAAQLILESKGLKWADRVFLYKNQKLLQDFSREKSRKSNSSISKLLPFETISFSKLPYGVTLLPRFAFLHHSSGYLLVLFRESNRDEFHQMELAFLQAFFDKIRDKLRKKNSSQEKSRKQKEIEEERFTTMRNYLHDNAKEVLFVEAERRGKTTVILNHQKKRKTFSICMRDLEQWVLPHFPEPILLRIHRSHFINPNQVELFEKVRREEGRGEKLQVWLNTDCPEYQVLPVGDSYMSSLSKIGQFSTTT